MTDKIIARSWVAENWEGITPINPEIETLRRRAEYLTDEINMMRRAMQHAGTWDQFCSDYAAYKRYREDATS